MTNLPIPGTEGPFDIPASDSTTLIVALLADTAASGLGDDPELLDLRFVCDNALISSRVTGVTTLGYAVSNDDLPDLPTAVVTLDAPGIIDVPQNSQDLFVVSTTNIGQSAEIRAEPKLELGGVITGLDPSDELPELTLTICETNPVDAVCIAEPTAFVDRTIATDEIVTFNVFVSSSDAAVPFIPERNRVYVLFREGADGPVRGGSSVAARTR